MLFINISRTHLLDEIILNLENYIVDSNGIYVVANDIKLKQEERS